MTMTESVIPLAGIALPLFLVPTIIAMKMEGKKREMRHAERMRAMEMGLPIPGDTGWAAATAIAMAATAPGVISGSSSALRIPVPPRGSSIQHLGGVRPAP